MIWGASSCPCVESVQGSTLMPVHVEREVRLLGRNLHLFQVSASCLWASLWPPSLLADHIQALGSRKSAWPQVSVPTQGLRWEACGVHRAQLLKLPQQHKRVLCPQDSPGDSECVMELEGREVVREARVECELPPDAQCRVTCQQLQVQTMGAWVGKARWPQASYQPQLAAPCSS